MNQLIQDAGYQWVDKTRKASIIIVNTCGFIGPAKEESLNVLSEFAKRKRKGQTLIAAGCLTQRYGAEVIKKIPEIDGILGTRRWMDIVKVIQDTRGDQHPKSPYHIPESGDGMTRMTDPPGVGRDEGGVLRAAIQGGSAYLKIADGCRRPCAFCAIPLIKGTVVSRPKTRILEEARLLQERGVKEIVLIAQDTTDYGHDLGMKDGLAQLLEDLVESVPDIPWLRVMYAYPGYVTDRLIDVMANFQAGLDSRSQHGGIVPYLDMPLQHAHPATLRRMRRPANIDWVHKTLEKMRKSMPTMALRSTFIVGYPGETESEFETLLDFLKEIRFDRVGAFQFSFEPGTTSERLGDPIPPEVKQERYERLMTIQQSISLEKNQTLVGKTLPVLVEGTDDSATKGKGFISLGRSYRDAPEIDGMVIITESDTPNPISVGEIAPVLINGAMAYDLSGISVNDGSALISPNLPASKP